ncbi:YeiH family protein [Amorphus orientalis]|uniref:Integral membrane protein (TIGR00698 family) n=1 Tax=Amorphus orientalis TaxID=649198 RepID=A0AAE3VKK5_9HYPH|nr:YeiH family protein [Amorphus orientalis]MDQ0313653.1 putative integral membrane protein (TIGR00698 family) [Amorphus orientalis]
MSSASTHHDQRRLRGLPWSGPGLRAIFPGLFIAGLVACCAFYLHRLPALGLISPMIIAVGLGALYTNIVGLDVHARPGVAFAQRPVLRLAIVLLGFQLTLGDILAIGFDGVGIVALTLAATFVFTVLAARVLRVDHHLGLLIAAGTSICGASAIVAANTVVRAKEGDVAYAVAAITLFGTLAMIGLPLLAPLLNLDPATFGLWAGASIHEVAQVVGASFQLGDQAGEIGTTAKLVRVALLAPVVLSLGFFLHADHPGLGRQPAVPGFIVGFVAAVAINSLFELPVEFRLAMATATTALLTVGLAALGLTADVSAIRCKGFRPLGLALLSTLFIAAFSLGLLELKMQFG